LKDIIEGFSTEYYQVSYEIKQSEDGYWFTMANVTRKDTGEEARFGASGFGKNSDEANSEVFDKIKKISRELSIQPKDWDSKGNKILARCLRISDEVTSCGIFIKENVPENVYDKLDDCFMNLCGYLINEVISIVKDISELSTDERLELLTSKQEVYNEPLDLWHLDDMKARELIYKFFLNPSMEEIKANESHIKAMKNML
jgi:hypothetical protein